MTSIETLKNECEILRLKIEKIRLKRQLAEEMRREAGATLPGQLSSTIIRGMSTEGFISAGSGFGVSNSISTPTA